MPTDLKFPEKVGKVEELFGKNQTRIEGGGWIEAIALMMLSEAS